MQDRDFVTLESGRVLQMIMSGLGSEHDLNGRLKTTGLDIEGLTYNGDLDIFSFAEVRGNLKMKNLRITGSLDLEGLRIPTRGYLTIIEVVIGGDLLIPESLFVNPNIIKGVTFRGRFFLK